MQIAAISQPASAAPEKTPAPAHRSAFRQLLSELNPLQYLPVVGTIYRAITGDTIPETERFAGSLVVSGLTGGPAGVAMNIGATALEHLLGIDPEKIGAHLLASLGVGPGPHAATQLANAAAATPPADHPASANAWSPAQLSAYGVNRTANGALSRGTLTGAELLNTLELARLGIPTPQAA